MTTYDEYLDRAVAVGIIPYTRKQWETMSAMQRKLIALTFVNGGSK